MCQPDILFTVLMAAEFYGQVVFRWRIHRFPA